MTKPQRVAVASRSFSRHPILRAELLAAHPYVTFNETGTSLSGRKLVDFLRGHDAAITALEIINEELLSELPDLRILSKYGVGYDMIDISALHRRGIRLGWTGGVNRRSVSELVISVAIMLLRHVGEAQAEVLGGKWRQIQGRQISGRTVGIIGCGHVGQDLATLLRAFGCKVLAHDIRDLSTFYGKVGVLPADIVTLLKTSDIVTLHLPLNDATRDYLSAEKLALMKTDAILINAARGGLVDEGKLKAMLRARQLGGAALDVFAEEPPQDRELLALPNVVVTPHIGGSSEEAVLAMGRAAIAGLADARLIEDGWPD